MHEETEIGGSQRSFPPTRLSLVDALAAADPGERRDALAEIVDLYWKPAYAYLRLRWRKDNEQAKDLTQAFFAALIEKDFLAGYDPLRARFRTYLRTCLDRFAGKDARAATAQKRGGHLEPAAFDFDAAERELSNLAAPATDSVDAWFEGEWRRGLLEKAIADLERECVARGHAQRFELFRRHHLAPEGDGARPTYEDLGRDVGLDATGVTNALAAVRRDFRRIVLERVRAWTRDDEEFQEELRALIGPGREPP